MNPIKAFVGHSFSETDQAVVTAFLSYFTTLGRGLPFSWTHAQAAEPTQVREKVLALIKEANLFIGICTQKEYAIDLGKRAAPRVLGWEPLRSDDLQMKASDWIIQEIGLASGLGLKIIVLLETGVRVPGGLIGDLEYIPFDRRDPKDCFDKIFEMITALTGAARAADVSQSAPSQSAAPHPDASPPEASESFNEEELRPLPQWEEQDYWKAIVTAIVYKKSDRIPGLLDALRRSAVGAGDVSAEMEALTEVTKLNFDSGGDIDKIKTLAALHPDNALIQQYHGSALLRFDQFAAASDKFHRASQLAKKPIAKIRNLTAAAQASLKAGRRTEADKYLQESRTLVGDDTQLEEVYLDAQAEIADLLGQKQLRVACLERLVELSPTNGKRRFSLAYSHSEEGRDALSLYHYLKLSVTEQEAGTANNIGVARERLELPIRSIQSYRLASESNYPLSLTNLAARYLDGGFLQDAQDMADKSSDLEEKSPNLGWTITQLKERPASEEEKESKILKEAVSLSRFYQIFGNSCTRALLEPLPQHWRSDEVKLLVATISEGTITVAGRYESRVGALGIAFNPSVTIEERIFRFVGTLSGASAIGWVRRDKVDTAASLMAPSVSALLCFERDGTTAHILESPSEGMPRSYKLTPTQLLSSEQ
jgi:hypothetical protein